MSEHESNGEVYSELGTITTIITPNPIDNSPEGLRLPTLRIEDYWTVSEVLYAVGSDSIKDIVNFVLNLHRWLKDEQHVENAIPILYTILDTLAKGVEPDRPKPAMLEWYDEREYLERVSRFTYNLVTQERIGYVQAAVIASALLGKEIKPEAWRKYLGRWAKQHGYQKPDLRYRTKNT